MAKKEEKGKKKKKGSSGPADALREAVERTFAGASGGATATRDRAQELLEDISTQLKGLREANLVGTLEGLRDDVQALARRVASLELRGGDDDKPAPTTRTARKPATRTATSRARPTTSRAKPATSRAKPTTTAAKKPATSRAKSATAGGAAKKPATSRAKSATAGGAAKKPATSRAKPATTRSRSTGTNARKPPSS